MANIKYQISKNKKTLRIGYCQPEADQPLAEKFDIGNLKFSRGFTIIEVLIVMTIALVMLGLTTMSLFRVQHKTSLEATVNTFLADAKEQQMKAMVGDTEGGVSAQTYGLHFDANNYTLFHGSTYNSSDSTNFVPAFPSSVQIATTFSGGNLIFTKGSGEVSNFISPSESVTFTDTLTNEQKQIIFNRYGIVTGVN